MSEKKIYVTAEIRINGIPAGNATPGGSLGPALGQKKIPAAKFCKEFNDLTADHKGKMCNIKIKLYSDQSYKIKFSFVSAAKMILETINNTREENAKKTGVKFEKITGSKMPGTSIVEQISKSFLKKLAEEKMRDMNTLSVDSALKTLMGTALSMGILVTGE